MRVLVISGDKSFGPGHPRYELQKSAVEELSVVYWGRGSMRPKVPAGPFDVVTVQDPLLRGAFAWRAAKKISARFNVQIHMDLRMLPWWSRVLAHFILRHADSIRVVSERVKAQVERVGVRAPVRVLPVFIDKEAIRAATPVDFKKELPQFEKIVFVASRLEPEKNVALAIKSFREVLRAVPKAGLLIAGEGSQFDELAQLVKKLKLEASVIFLGQRTDVFSIYKSADVLLSTSRYEGFGASIVEALCAGCPVVSTDVGVAREAGAIIATKKEIGKKAVEVLQSDVRGELQLVLPPAFEWAKLWRDSLTV